MNRIFDVVLPDVMRGPLATVHLTYIAAPDAERARTLIRDHGRALGIPDHLPVSPSVRNVKAMPLGPYDRRAFRAGIEPAWDRRRSS